MQNTIDFGSIKAINRQGYAYYADGHYPRALRSFYAAWLELPKPQTDCPVAATILSGIGDSYFKMRKYTLAIEALRSALSCPKSPEEGLILLRLGQCLHTTGQEEQATTYLRRAFSLGGETLFASEHPKYLRAIHDLIV